MNVTIITDACSEDDFARTATRTACLFNCNVNTVGVNKFAELEASGCLVDAIDAFEENKGIILVNAAPRYGKAKKWENGTPFGFFIYKNILIVSTVDGKVLSLAKNLGIVKDLKVTEMSEVLKFAVSQKLIEKDLADYIVGSQFRSYDYEPKLAYWINNGINIPSKDLQIDLIENADNLVWYIDTFGNVKTTLELKDLPINNGTVKTKFGEFKFFNRLKDVPNNEIAVIIGSSGLQNHKYAELIIQGESFAERFNVKVGDFVLI